MLAPGAKIIEDDVIESGLVALGLEGKAVEIHSSLSSFGHVAGGAKTVVRALLNVCATVLMPTYSNMGAANPPERDRPRQNGWDYEDYQVPSENITPFDPDNFGADSHIFDYLGIMPLTLLRTKGTIRSKHPSGSWSANGGGAANYVDPHPLDDPMRPIKKLYEANGCVLMLGVPLSTCSALHLAEEMVGRRPFIRWILYNDGVVRRIRVFGCSQGFVNLEPDLGPLANRIRIGACHATVFPIRELVKTGAAIMRQTPEITMCRNGKGCGRCRAAVKGGPIE